MHVMSDQSHRKPGPDLERHDTFATGNPPVHVTQLSGVLEFGYARREWDEKCQDARFGEVCDHADVLVLRAELWEAVNPSVGQHEAGKARGTY